MIAFKRFGFGLLVGLDLWISLCLAALTLFMNRVSELPIQTDAVMLVFFSTLVVYNIDHIRDRAYISSLHRKLRWTTVAIASVATFVLVDIAPLTAQICFLSYFLVGCIYSAPLGSTKSNNLRCLIGRLKPVLVSGAIMIAAAGLPVCWYGSIPSSNYLFVTLLIFQLVLMAVMFFDVIDEEGCADSKLGSADTTLTMPRLALITAFYCIFIPGLLKHSLIGTAILAFSGAMFVQFVICVILAQTKPSDHRELGRFLADGALCAPLCIHIFLS